MRRTFALATIVVLAGLAAGCGGSDESSTSSTTTEWADSVCTAITTWTDELQQLKDQLGASPSKEGLQQAADDAKTATDTLVADLKGLGAPETESGQEAKNAIDQLGTTLEDDISEIQSTAEGVSGLTGVPSAITSISTVFASMATAFSSTLQTIEDADPKGELKDAFDQASSCKELTGSSS